MAGSAHAADSRSQFLRREQACPDEQPSMLNAVHCVDAQDLDGCTTDGGSADQLRTAPAKMFVPIVDSWIEERNESIRQRIVTRRVGPLPRVARQTRQGRIGYRRGAPVLLRPDVVQLETASHPTPAASGSTRSTRRLDSRPVDGVKAVWASPWRRAAAGKDAPWLGPGSRNCRRASTCPVPRVPTP